jgi:hypothetical protein
MCAKALLQVTCKWHLTKPAEAGAHPQRRCPMATVAFNFVFNSNF